MEAILAGLLAWSIEIFVALSAMFLLKREEKKVINRRNKNVN